MADHDCNGYSWVVMVNNAVQLSRYPKVCVSERGYAHLGILSFTHMIHGNRSKPATPPFTVTRVPRAGQIDSVAYPNGCSIEASLPWVGEEPTDDQR